MPGHNTEIVYVASVEPVGPDRSGFIVELVLESRVVRPVARAFWESDTRLVIESLGEPGPQLPGNRWLRVRLEEQVRFFLLGISDHDPHEYLSSRVESGINPYPMLYWRRIPYQETRHGQPDSFSYTTHHYHPDIDYEMLSRGIRYCLDQSAPIKVRKPYIRLSERAVMSVLTRFFEWKIDQLANAIGIPWTSDHRKSVGSSTRRNTNGGFVFQVSSILAEVCGFQLGLFLDECSDGTDRLVPTAWIESTMVFPHENSDGGRRTVGRISDALAVPYLHVLQEELDVDGTCIESELDPECLTSQRLQVHLLEVCDPWIAMWQHMGGLAGLGV